MAEEAVTNEDVGALFLGEDASEPETTEDKPSEAPQTLSEDDTEEIVEDEGVEAANDDDASEGDSEPESEDAPESEFVEVEFDGRLYEVPQELKDALLRQSDYTTKTQEVSAQRKQAEIQLAQVEQAAQRFELSEKLMPKIMEAQMKAAEAEQYQAYLTQYINSPDFSSQTVEQIREKIRQSQHEAQQIAQQVQAEQQELQQAQEQAHAELLKKGTEVLNEKIPNWGEASQKQLMDYGLGSGFSEQELRQLVDPREVEVLWKASQYDALQAGKSQAVKKVEAAPQIKPKSRNPMPKDVQNKLNIRKKLKSNNLTKHQKQSLIAEDIGQRWG